MYGILHRFGASSRKGKAGLGMLALGLSSLSAACGAYQDPVDSARVLTQQAAVAQAAVQEVAAMDDGLRHGTVTSGEAIARLQARLAQLNTSVRRLETSRLDPGLDRRKAALIDADLNLERTLQGAIDALKDRNTADFHLWYLRALQTSIGS